ncbi:MAG: hypothetical protein V2I53_13025, partial [Paracoccaceae bacterium]|nr:hypothetical protein [Paracoccaceae bacterium]
YGIELLPERERGRAKVVAVAGAGLDLQSLNPMAAMEQFARDAGYDVEHAETARGRRGRDRWLLVPRGGAGPGAD